jgi:hypothetical protein
VADIDYSYQKADAATYSTILVEYKDLIWNITNTAITKYLIFQKS